MRVLITGGLGFIGSWTARTLLEAGHAVRIFDFHSDRALFDEIVSREHAPNVEQLAGDITEPADVDVAVSGCDAIVHLAGILVPGCRADPIAGMRVNVLGTLHAFAAAMTHRLRGFAYASSAAVFGPDDGSTPHPITHYGAYKLCKEGNARAFWEDEHFSSVGLRPWTVYGPGREIGITAGPRNARGGRRARIYDPVYGKHRNGFCRRHRGGFRSRRDRNARRGASVQPARHSRLNRRHLGSNPGGGASCGN